MRSRNDLPGSCVTSITSRSESSFVPPVTAERSPPDSRMTGADSPVIADSSTEPTPSMISPSAGMTSPASTTTTSPRCSSAAGTRAAVATQRSAFVVVRVARSALACALPRPSAIASAKFANSTVSQSQTAIVATNQSWLVSPRAELEEEDPRRDHAAELDDEHHRVPHLERGSSFGNESRIAASTSSREKTLPRAARPSATCPSELVESEIELEDVDAGLAEEAEAAPVGVVVRSASAPSRAAGGEPRRCGATAAARWPARCPGRCPEPDVVTASTGMSPIVRPGLYGPSSLRIACAAALTFFARSRVRRPEVRERRRRRRCRPAPSRTGAGGSTAGSVKPCAASASRRRRRCA